MINRKTTTTQYFLIATAAAIVLFISITSSFGQKEEFEVRRATTREGTIDTGYMTKADVSDDLDGTDDEYFYKFSAVPGKLTITVEITANETNAGATVDLFGANNKAILSNMLIQAANGGTEQVSKSVNLAKSQDIIIRIKGMRYGSSSGYPGIYKIRLEGTAAKFNSVPQAATVDEKKPEVPPMIGTVDDKNPVTAPTVGGVENTTPGTTRPVETGEIKNQDTTQPAVTVQGDKSTATPPNETVKDKKPDAVDRAVEKGKTKGKKLLDILNKVKTKIPD